MKFLGLPSLFKAPPPVAPPPPPELISYQYLDRWLLDSPPNQSRLVTLTQYSHDPGVVRCDLSEHVLTDAGTLITRAEGTEKTIRKAFQAALIALREKKCP